MEEYLRFLQVITTARCSRDLIYLMHGVDGAYGKSAITKEQHDTLIRKITERLPK
jgi:hypothetical protein